MFIFLSSIRIKAAKQTDILLNNLYTRQVPRLAEKTYKMFSNFKNIQKIFFLK